MDQPHAGQHTSTGEHDVHATHCPVHNLYDRLHSAHVDAMSRNNKTKRQLAAARVHSDRRVEARREEARRELDRRNLIAAQEAARLAAAQPPEAK